MRTFLIHGQRKLALKQRWVVHAFVISCAVWCSACSQSTPATKTATPTPSSTPTTINTCSTSVIDYGQKGTVTAVGRGVYSDTKLFPGTSYPAVAYSDPGSVTLKFTYWDGSQFNTEVAAGDGAGTFVRLAFLSSGVPLIFWAQGGNLKVAIRSAAIPSAGTWNAGVIDTGTAPRAIEVSVNPLDQVAVSFVTDTAVAGRPKFLYCNSPCTTPSGFLTMTPNSYIENTNLIAAQTSTGVGWCKASSTQYYPAVVYAVTGLVRYAVCQNSISNCLNSTNWTTQTVIATGNVASKLHLDSSITGDVPKVVSLGASGVVTYKMGTTACTAAPAAFAAGSTIGTATTGTQWMSLSKDSDGSFHLLANEGTTSLRYYNSVPATDINGAWNAQSTVETTTLATAHGGGAEIDPSTSGIYLSYSQNAAPFDVRLARVTDTTVASNSATFSKFNIDLTGGMQLTAAAAQLRNVSAAATSSGRPAVAYVDYSIGAAANAKLKFAYRTGSSSSDLWDITIVPGTGNPQFPGLAYDQDNKPWISYFDALTSRFFLVTNSSTDGTGVWRSYEFPATPAGAPAALPAANSTAVAMLVSGGTTKPVMVVVDSNAGSKGVKAALFNPTLSSWSAVTTIDALTGATAAAHLSADSDSSGNVVIGYNELNVARARYSMSSNGTTWTTPLSISSVNQGQGVTIKINPATGYPVMTYFDRANNSIYYAACTGTPTACSTTGWSPSAIDMTAGVSGLVAGNDQLLSVGLAFKTSGVANVIYPRGQGATGSLVLSTNSSGSFDATTLATGSNGGLSGTVALNFAVAGWNVSSTRNAAGNVFSAFLGPGNWLYATSCGD